MDLWGSVLDMSMISFLFECPHPRGWKQSSAGHGQCDATVALIWSMYWTPEQFCFLQVLNCT